MRDVIRQQGLHVAYLEQEVPRGLQGRVGDILGGGLDGLPLSSLPEDETCAAPAHRIRSIGRMQLDPTAAFESLSAGMKRRVLLAVAWCATRTCCCSTSRPTIWTSTPSPGWRTFCCATAARWSSSPTTALPAQAGHAHRRDRPRPAHRLVVRLRHVPARARRRLLTPRRSQNALFDKKLAQEEAWIRQGIKARRTRNEGRVRALEALREAAPRAPRTAAATCGCSMPRGRALGQAGDRGRKASASATATRADRPRLLHHHHARRQGRHHRPQRLRQDHAAAAAAGRAGAAARHACATAPTCRSPISTSCAPSWTKTARCWTTSRDGRDFVTVNGKRRHIIGYLQDFLFSPERARVPVSVLSGGERNRLLLARLFTQPVQPAGDGRADQRSGHGDAGAAGGAACWTTRARCCWSATTARF